MADTWTDVAADEGCARQAALGSGRCPHNAWRVSQFPDPRSMTQLATSLGISAGWYANNCHCADHSATCKAERGAECTRGDVDAVVGLGFRSLKVDGCGA